MKYVVIFINLIFFISCTRTAQNNEKSILKFDFSKVQYKNSVLANNNFPETSEICYGVNITSADLPSKDISCGPRLGLTAGFVPSGSEVSLEVPSGDNRNIDLYMYLPLGGEACPGVENSKIDPSLLFKVSSKPNVSLNSAEVVFEMPVEFPGYDHSVFDDMNLPMSCLDNEDPAQPENPNAPKIITASLDTNSITSSGVDETLTLTLLVNAIYQPNWLNVNHYGPLGNLSGGGSSQMFYSCTSTYNTNPTHICYGYDETYYFAIKTFSVSQWAPNGNYYIDLIAQDTMYYISNSMSVTYNITNHAAPTPPTIANIVINPDASLTSGSGGNVIFDILVHSISPPNFLIRSLQRPDTSYVFGGGSGVSFTNCTSYTSNPAHICYAAPADHWFYSYTDNFTSWAQNGTYTYLNIEVLNAATMSSGFYVGTPTFQILGNPVAFSPTITAVESYYAFDGSSIPNGIPYYFNSCVRASEGSNLELGLRIIANTNAPINFINYTLDGPSNTILGGGNGTSSNYLTTDTYETILQNNITGISGRERGYYTWLNISVANQGGLGSAAVGPFGLDVQDSCFTLYNNIKSGSSPNSCGISSSGELKCWGANTSNIIDHGSPANNRKYPTVVQGNTQFIDVDSGSTHTCAVSISNQALCWGGNSYGQLGDGTNAASAKPVNAAAGDFFQKISAGGAHTCGITVSGVLKCWGQNTFGQLGDGTTTSRNTAVLIDSGVQYIAVSSGYTHTCGITVSGVLKCWGQNTGYQLGDGTATNRTTPTIINSGTSFNQVSAGYQNSCGITNSGVLKCWGQNTYGQIGDNSATTRTSPTIVDSGVSYLDISTKQYHTCGITISNDLKCWGKNTTGALGIGSYTNSLAPSLVGTGYFKVSTGANHTCAIQSSGVMSCWGENTYNQLGDGTTTTSPIPVQIDLQCFIYQN